MMQDSTGDLKDLCGDLPVDVLRYFERIKDGSWSNAPGLELNLLPLEQALELTRTFREFDEVVIALSGLMLDDANTSNHHVYLAHPACLGSILYRAHDGDSAIVFASLDEFFAACQSAKDTGKSVRDLHSKPPVVLPDQAALGQFIDDLASDRCDCDGLLVVLSLIPSMDLENLELLNRLAANDDFYVAEAVGRVIAARPRQHLRPIAEVCSAHSHIQASRAGRMALNCDRCSGPVSVTFIW